MEPLTELMVTGMPSPRLCTRASRENIEGFHDPARKDKHLGKDTDKVVSQSQTFQHWLGVAFADTEPRRLRL